MAEKDFDRAVELLHVLVRDFVAAESDSLDQVLQDDAKAAESDAASPVTDVEVHPIHPKVSRALRYIEEHIREPNLNVHRIADELDLNPAYLSQLFVEHVGERMRRFISVRRLELAKHLLATTDWQIKRIARETGHANPGWFCYVFRGYTGATPSAFRRGLQRRSARFSPRPQSAS